MCATRLPLRSATVDEATATSRTIALVQTTSIRGNRAEQPVRLVVGPRREEQRGDGTVVGRAMAELQRPEPGNHDPLVVGASQRADQLKRAVWLRLVGVDAAVAE